MLRSPDLPADVSPLAPGVGLGLGWRVVALVGIGLGLLALRACERYTSEYQTLPVVDWLESRPPLAESADLWPPAAADLARASGCWIALGAAALQLFGALLTLSRVSFAINIEGRDTRRRVAAVDARDPTTTESDALFSRPAGPVAPPPEAPAAPEPATPEGDDSGQAAALEGDGPGARVEEASSGPVRRTSASRRKT
jgi:hypothetical protein